MEAIAISFARSKNDLVLTCNLEVWQRLRNRFGYREKDYVELSYGIMMRAEVTVFCNLEGFCLECSTFPDTHTRCEAEPAMLEIAGKRLVLTIPEYESQPLRLFSTGNYGFFIEHYGLSRQGKANFDLKAWISFRPPAPVIKDERIWTPGELGSHFESKRKRH